MVWVWICLPETKGLPLEEVAAIFGDQDEVIVLSSAIQVDPNSEEVAVNGEKTDEITSTHKERAPAV